MMDLDSPEYYRRQPFSRAFSILDRYIDDLKDGIEAGRKVEVEAEGIGRILLVGVGGSGIICDVAAQILRGAGIQAEVAKGYEARSMGHDLAIAVSHSGDTAETVGAVLKLLEAGGKCVFITSNGILRELGERMGIPMALVRGDVPPRYGFPSMIGAALGILEKIGLISIDVSFQRLLRLQSEIREEVSVDENPAKKLALKIAQKRLPIIYVYDEVRSVGYRLKCQLNENAKMYCGFAEIPEAFHNEVEGIPPDSLIILPRSFREPWEMTQAIESFTRYLGQGSCISIWAESRDSLNECLELFLLVDYTSLYVAMLRGVDPIALPRVTELRNLNKAYREVLRRAREVLGRA